MIHWYDLRLIDLYPRDRDSAASPGAVGEPGEAATEDEDLSRRKPKSSTRALRAIGLLLRRSRWHSETAGQGERG